MHQGLHRSAQCRKSIWRGPKIRAPQYRAPKKFNSHYKEPKEVPLILGDLPYISIYIYIYHIVMYCYVFMVHRGLRVEERMKGKWRPKSKMAWNELEN